MSTHTYFPDAIVFPDGTIRLVTFAAKLWAYSNTEIKGRCSVNTVPDYVDFEDSIPQMMEDLGYLVKREPQPAFHYCGRHHRLAKKRASSDPEGKIVYFEEYRAMSRGFTSTRNIL